MYEPDENNSTTILYINRLNDYELMPINFPQ